MRARDGLEEGSSGEGGRNFSKGENWRAPFAAAFSQPLLFTPKRDLEETGPLPPALPPKRSLGQDIRALTKGTRPGVQCPREAAGPEFGLYLNRSGCPLRRY